MRPNGWLKVKSYWLLEFVTVFSVNLSWSTNIAAECMAMLSGIWPHYQLHLANVYLESNSLSVVEILKMSPLQIIRPLNAIRLDILGN